MGSAAIAVQSIQRRMRGGSQAFLVQGADNHFYVAKCAGNPQGTRTLINEWIATRLLKLLQVRTPEAHLLQFERGVQGEDLLEFHLKDRRMPVRPGLHFGSRCPVDPERIAIFDFLPRRLLSKVVNIKDLTRAFVFDKWVSQTDTRQAIFVRQRSADQKAKFVAYILDHGLSFSGSRWEFSDAPLHGLYFDRSIYDQEDLERDCSAAVDQILSLPEESIAATVEDIPPEWFEAGDKEELEYLLESLDRRRAKLNEIVEPALKQIREAGRNLSKAGLLLILLIVSAALSPLAPTSSRTVGVNLSAFRDVDYSTAPAGRQLAFTAEAYDATDRFLTMEIVNAYGLRIWMGPATLTNGHIEATAPPIHTKGEYFFRLYGGLNGGNQPELLREYAVVVE